MGESDWPRIIDGMAVLSEANIFIDDTPGIKISEIRSKCRRLKIEKGLDLILIDYLQLMEEYMILQGVKFKVLKEY